MEDIENIFRDELQDFFVPEAKVQAHITRANEHLAEKKERLAAHAKQIEKVRAEMRKVYNLYQSRLGFAGRVRQTLPAARRPGALLDGGATKVGR